MAQAQTGDLNAVVQCAHCGRARTAFWMTRSLKGVWLCSNYIGCWQVFDAKYGVRKDR